MSSNKPTSTGNVNDGGGGNFTEYKLKMSPMAVSHNVMVLNSSTAKLSDFTQPVRMFRDKNSALIQEAPAKAAQPEGFGKIAVGGGSINAPGSRPSFKKKTKIFFQGDEEEFDEQVRETEAVPWLLEDFDAQHSFVGKLEGGQSSNYVFFVNQGDEFRIIPVNKWYRFQSKLSYHTLSLDEAETQMAAKKKDDVSRWLMKNRPVQKASEEDVTVSEGPKLMKLAEKVLNDENEQRRRQAQIIRSKKEDAQRGEELDFDELFDDDEGNDNFGGLLDDLQPEDSNELATNKKSNYKLSNEGKAMKKIVRHLDKSNDIIYASDDENDPYASDYENDEDEDDFDKWSKESSSNSSTGGINSASVPSGSAAHVNKPKQPQPQSQGIKATSSTATSRASSLSVSPITSKSPSPPGSPNNKRPTTTTPSKRSKTSDDEESNNLISEIEIIGHLRQGPISTKDLIAKFKRQLKADPKNKEIFRELVRKLAMVKTFVGSGEEDKLLELKPEFK
jgi:transcription initiation factor TFIIF subunit alpha